MYTYILYILYIYYIYVSGIIIINLLQPGEVDLPLTFDLHTDQVSEEDSDLPAFVSEPAGHPLPHLHGGADDPPPHDGAEVLHHHPTVHLRHQQLDTQDSGVLSPGTVWYRVVPCGTVWYRVVPCGTVWYRVVPCGTVWYLVGGAVHAVELLEGLLDDGLHLLVRLHAAQPLPLHQAL